MNILNQVLGLKSKLAMILSGSMSVLCFFIDFVTEWIFSPMWALILFWVLILFDFISALSVAYKRGDTFRSNKALKSVKVIVVYTFILGMFHNIPRINDEFGIPEADFIIDKFPGALYIYIFCIVLMSFIKNVVILGLFKGKAANFIYKYIDAYKNTVEDPFVKNKTN